jgi:uncharacterized protein (DUF983 family)
VAVSLHIMWRPGACRSTDTLIYCRPACICAVQTGHAIYGAGLRPLACWDCEFESHRGHGYLSVLVLCVTTNCRACDLETSWMRPWPWPWPWHILIVGNMYYSVIIMNEIEVSLSIKPGIGDLLQKCGNFFFIFQCNLYCMQYIYNMMHISICTVCSIYNMMHISMLNISFRTAAHRLSSPQHDRTVTSAALC